MKKAIVGGLGVLALIAGGLFLDFDPEEIDPNLKIRVARIPNTCPTKVCEYGAIQKKGFCACLTRKPIGKVPNEQTSISADKAQRLVVCEVTDPQHGTKYITPRYEKSTDPLKIGCVIAADLLLEPNTAFHNVDTDTVVKLREACTPCILAADAWGACPECLHPKTPSCAEACKDER